MKLKTPKSDRKRSGDTRAKRMMRTVLTWAVIIVLLGLAGSHMFSNIVENAAMKNLLSMPGDVVSTTVTPVQSAFSGLVDGLVDYLYKLKLRSRIELEYNNIKQENEQLIYDAMLVEELQHKLSVYENLYDEISVNESMNPLVATVIGRESGNYFSVFTINKGSKHGVQDYMAVTMDGALVGYTYNVSDYSSTVRTIIDSEASIAGLISSSRDQGTIRGTLGVDGTALCRMYYLPEDNLPRPGDLVVTSGVGMSFPKGIPIGTVKESTRGMESNKQFVVVNPQADFQHIEYVIVLRYQPEALEVEERSSSNDTISITPIESAAPVPTIQIGSDFYQLAPTPIPTPEPSPAVIIGEDGEEIIVTPAPTTDTSISYEYQIPSGAATDNAYGFTLPPTAPPTPTPPPLDLTVEED